MRIRFWVMTLIFLMFFGMPYNKVEAREDQKAERFGNLAVLVIMDRISLEDLEEAHTPNIDKLINSGCIGLMNTNTAGSRNQKNAYATIGAGTRAVNSQRGHLAFNALDEYEGYRGDELYKQCMGIDIKPSNIVNLGAVQMVRNNKEQKHKVVPGMLGQQLRENGITTVVLGNEDTGEQIKRNITAIAMDTGGIIDCGKINDDLLMDKSDRPFGVMTDYEGLLEEFDKYARPTSFIAIQLGDTSRAEDFRLYTSDEMLLRYRIKAIEEGDAFIGRLLERMDLEKDIFILASPYPNAKAMEVNNRLTPVILAGRGIHKGWATSSTTKRAGVITNLDIAATILDYFRIEKPAVMLGNPIYSTENGRDREELVAFNKRLFTIYNNRPGLLKGYTSALIFIPIIAVAVLIYRGQHSKGLKPMLVGAMSVPLIYLLLPIIMGESMWYNAALAIALVILTTFVISHLLKGNIRALIGLCVITAVLVIADLLMGAPLIKESPLGYDVIAGARYYGIGNELTGVVIGSAMVSAFGILNFWGNKKVLSLGKYVLVIILAFITFVIISPRLGANVGGGIGSFIGFGTGIAMLFKDRMSIKQLLFILAGLTIFLMCIFVWDWLRPDNSQTHIGRTLTLIEEEGIISLFTTAYRKLDMNIRLIKYTIWSRVFLVSLFIIVALLYRPVGLLKEVMEENKILGYGLLGAAVGGIASLFVNDSGIVTAATTMIYVTPTIVYMVVEKYWSKKEKEAHVYESVAGQEKI
ncbi:MAG TPA: hypothetical protein GXZ32_08545 [Clostridiales bacterium]|nr:hypothetical protein [Clostridiales bacterium]